MRREPWVQGTAAPHQGFKVLSLGDFMKKIEIASYYDIGSMIAMTSEFASRKEKSDLSEDDIKALSKELGRIKEHLEAVEMRHSLAQLNHILFKFEQKDLTTWNEAKAKFDSLNIAALRELNDIFVGYIPADRAAMWGQEKPFGKYVYDNFESARADAAAACNCYAVEQYTASVFHLMRVAELGLRALARERRVKKIGDRAIEYADWQQVIDALNKKVEQLARQKRGAAREAALTFYRGAIADCSAFKDIYRHPIMHSRKSYVHIEAGIVHMRVGEFMNRLATKLDEHSNKQIVWGIR